MLRPLLWIGIDIDLRGGVAKREAWPMSSKFCAMPSLAVAKARSAPRST
jgi:hypothetical protein